MFPMSPFLLFVSLLSVYASAVDTIYTSATNCTDIHACVGDPVFGSAVDETWSKSLMNRFNWVRGVGQLFKHDDNDAATFHSDERYWEIRVPGSPTEQSENLEGVLSTFIENHNTVCYNYCVRIDDSGNWKAYVKMYHPNQDNGLKKFGCSSGIHFTPACSSVIHSTPSYGKLMGNLWERNNEEWIISM